MTTALDQSFEDSKNGGNFQIGAVSNFGSTAFVDEMETMSVEFPMLTLASQVNKTADGVACKDFYVNNLELTED